MNQPLLTEIRTLIAQQFNVDMRQVTPDTDFRETLAADSLELIELTMAVVRLLNNKIVIDEDMKEVETVRELVAYVERKAIPAA
jgi:acyl carrier protein